MPELPTTEQLAVLRMLDANFNRASEGLRVIEEFVRFGGNDRFLSERLKALRHALSVTMQAIDFRHLLAARDTERDTGTSISLATESQRENIYEVLRANFQRVQQALRSLEEYGKTVNIRMAAEIEQLRYQTYTLEKAILRTASAREQLQHDRLYVLIAGCSSLAEFRQLAESLVAAGVDVLQLREKQLTDRLLLERAQCLREITRNTATLFIMNDRPDIASLADADGVHVGQDELCVAEVRKIVGPNMLIGVSTHNLPQVQRALLAGADYIGCGPTFPSTTKSFEHFPGLDFLRAVANEISLPAFAIGGITSENLAAVLATGLQRIAVSGAITSAVNPAEKVSEFKRLLRQLA